MADCGLRVGHLQSYSGPELLVEYAGEQWPSAMMVKFEILNILAESRNNNIERIQRFVIIDLNFGIPIAFPPRIGTSAKVSNQT